MASQLFRMHGYTMQLRCFASVAARNLTLVTNTSMTISRAAGRISYHSSSIQPAAERSASSVTAPNTPSRRSKGTECRAISSRLLASRSQFGDGDVQFLLTSTASILPRPTPTARPILYQRAGLEIARGKSASSLCYLVQSKATPLMTVLLASSRLSV